MNNKIDLILNSDTISTDEDLKQIQQNLNGFKLKSFDDIKKDLDKTDLDRKKTDKTPNENIKTGRETDKNPEKNK